jgi:hypothetical protein
MKYTLLLILNLLLSCNARQGASINTLKNNVSDNKETKVASDTLKKAENNSFNPPFYLRIIGVYTGNTWYDNNIDQDKVFRIVKYINETHITIIIETIEIGSEGGSLTLLKQEKLTEEKLGMPSYTINNVDLIDWINSKEAKLKINDKCFIVDLEKLTYKPCN